MPATTVDAQAAHTYARQNVQPLHERMSFGRALLTGLGLAVALVLLVIVGGSALHLDSHTVAGFLIGTGFGGGAVRYLLRKRLSRPSRE